LSEKKQLPVSAILLLLVEQQHPRTAFIVDVSADKTFFPL